MKIATLLLLCTALFAQQKGTFTDMRDGKTKAPYEATWLKIIKMNNSYAVLNYPSLHPSLLNAGKTRTMWICKAESDSMIWTIFSDEPEVFKYKDFNVVKLNDNSYEFNSKTKKQNDFRFDYVDKSNHIAQWSVYYSYGKLQATDMYIDSLYNTFPIVDVEVEFDESDY